MRNIVVGLLVIFLSFFSCSRRLCACDPAVPPHIKAVVLESNNIDCLRPVIKIDAADVAEVSRITGVSADTYVVSQLPDNLKSAGQKLYIEIGIFAAGEDFACTNLGPSYAHLKVVTAIHRN